MQSLHRNLGFFIAIVNGVVGVWALVSIRVRWLEQPAMWWAIAVAQLSALVQVVLGVYLLTVQGDEVAEFHVFYGVLVAIAIALAFIYARGSEWVQERRALFYGLVSLFLMGLALRAIGLAGGFGVIRLGVLFGGRSGEHDVSCASALAVLRALDPTRYEAVPLGIRHDGVLVLPPPEEVAAAVAAHDSTNAIAEHLVAEGRVVSLQRGVDEGTVQVVVEGATEVLHTLDAVFPVLHGPFGEDGTIQGWLEVLGVPYVGSGVLGSSVGMDKVAMKRAFRAEGIPQVRYVWWTEPAWRADPEAAASVVQALGLPLFVKPADLGSSVGVTRVDEADDLPGVVDEAFRHDHVTLIESGVTAREVECGVMGGLDAEASLPGEIVVPGTGFYDYASKYLEEGAQTIVPADLPPPVVDEIRRLAVAAYEAVGAWGLARVDCFYDPASGDVFVNEINTIPGFTPISMFSKMWDASGVPYAAQIDRLVDLAFERHQLFARRGRA